MEHASEFNSFESAHGQQRFEQSFRQLKSPGMAIEPENKLVSIYRKATMRDSKHSQDGECHRLFPRPLYSFAQLMPTDDGIDCFDKSFMPATSWLSLLGADSLHSIRGTPLHINYLGSHRTGIPLLFPIR